MRRYLSILSLAASLALTATALAVLPPGGTRFKGTTSAPVMTGKSGQKFKDPVSFSLTADRKHIRKFKFGLLGCFGSGGPPPNTNPYTSKFATAKLASLVVTAAGKFSGKQHEKVGSTPTDIAVQGRFAKSRGRYKAAGTITFSHTASFGGS